MAIADPSIKETIETRFHYMEWVAPIVGAALVVIAGRLIAKRYAARAAAGQPAASGGEEAA
jgi:hypothetical protein